jgi:hypothetical protein
MKSELCSFIVAGFLAAGLVVGLAGCQKESAPPSSEPKTLEVAPDSSTNAAAATRPEFQKLIGKWLRPDGGYVLELQSVSADGKIEAYYFNPGPIHVSKAVAIKDGVTTKVFVELQDVNYPGCTYSLTYDDKTDQLFGQYFQAAQQQTYDVTFGRLKE